MPGDDASPWSEQRWARFIQRSEARAARYQELLETLEDHPDAEALIAREMGWPELEAEDDTSHPEWVAAEDVQCDAGDVGELDHELEATPVYVLARAVAVEVLTALRPYGKAADVDGGDEADERLEAVLSNAMLPGAKLAGGHALGDDPEMIGGQIVYCLKALDAAWAACEDLRWLTDRGHLPAAVAQPLLHRLEELARMISRRVDKLRGRSL